MKTPTARHIISIICLLVLAGTIRSQAQSGTWTNIDSSIWSDATNWLNNIVANGANNVGAFSNEVSAAVQVDLDTPRTIGGLQFILGTYTIGNNTNDANILTLAGATKPVISVPATTTATIRSTAVAGTDGFIVDGGGTLAFFKQTGDPANTVAMPANTITGNVILTNNSTLAAQEGGLDDNPFDLAYDSLGSITFYGDGANGSTFNCLSDASTGPSYGTVNNNLIVPAGQVGTIILSPRTDGSSGDNAGAIGTGYGGTLTGGGTLNVVTRYVRGNVVGDWSAFTGQINITPGSAAADNQFRFGNPAGFTNASVDLGGGSALAFRYYRSLTVNTNIVIGVLSSANAAAALVGSDSAAFTLFFDVNAKHANATDISTFAGTIVNNAGPAGLIKRGAGTLILTGDNTHTGPTVIASGVLQIGDGSSEAGSPGNGSITNNGSLIITRGGSLTVPGNITGAGGLTNIGAGGSTVTLTGTNTYTGPTHVASGKLVFGTASRSATPITVADAASLGVVVTSSGGRLTNMNNVTFGTGCSLDFDMSGFGNSPVGVSIATNRGNIAFNGSDVTVNIAGTNFQVGIITLLTYTNRTGAGSFVLGTLPPNISSATLTDDTVNRQVRLNIASVFYPPDPTLGYVGNAAGIWDIDNPANQIWVELRTAIVTNYYEGAPARIDDSAAGTNNITLGATVSPSGITVSNSTRAYTISDPTSGFSIGGFGGLTKQGTNKLTIANLNNSFSGLIRIDEGTLEVGDGANSGSLGSGVISNNTTLLLNSGGLNSGAGVTLPNAIHGPGTVIQINTNETGVATLSGASTYTGGLVVKPNTTLAYNSANAAGIGGNLRIESGTVTLGANNNGNIGSFVIISNATIRNNGANRVIESPIVGTNVVVAFDKTPNLITVNADMHGVSGIITNMGTGLLRFNSGGGNNCTGSSNALWVLATPGGFLQARNSSDNHLGAVQGVGTISAQQSAGGSGLTTWLIGGLNTDTVFEGVVNDGAAFAQLARFTGITKVGTGTLVLSNATLSHRASTRVNSGTLALKGTSLPTESTNITVAAPGVLDVSGRTDGTLTLGASTTNQTLMGDGTIIGNVVLGAFASLQPGLSIGVLTNIGTFTMGGTNIFELAAGSSPNSDRLVSTGGITYGGRLILTNIGGAVAGTKVFQLFSGPVSGSFSTIVTQAIPGVTWDLTQLNVNGSISLVGSIPTTPTNIVFSTSSTNLTLQWPQDYTGWTLQTNSVGITNSEAWFAYPGSSGTNQVTLGFDQTKTNVFFRLRLIP